jgi:hypothetical protein
MTLQSFHFIVGTADVVLYAKGKGKASGGS